MKIVFSDLPMKKELHGFKYKVDGNATIEYDGETIFPVNSVLAKTMKKGEKVKVVLLSKVDIALRFAKMARFRLQQRIKCRKCRLRFSSFPH